MSVQLLASTRAIMDEVLARTGKPVIVREADEELSAFARVRIARRGMDAHVILVAKSHRDIASYLVAHECSHILRLFAAPAEERRVPMTTAEHSLIAKRDMERESGRLAKAMPAELLSAMVERWHQGIVSQVTNQPADIMVERWILREHEELRPQQQKALQKMHRDAVRGLDEGIRALTPSKVYGASMAMNYAFFSELTDVCGEERFRPFRKSAYAEQGERLLGLKVEGPQDSLAWDVRMTSAWAEVLGIRAWFSWTEFESVPPGYA